MKIILVILLGITAINVEAINTNELIVQGESKLTFDDIDGFASTIPFDKQNGFFESPIRIDTTLNTLLTMKHITNYAKKENLVDEFKVSKKVSEYLQLNEKRIEKLNLSDFEYLKLKKFLLMKYSYMFMQSYIKNLVEEKHVLDLAEERYELNKDIYFIDRELRDIQYINIHYTDEDKAEKLLLSKEIKNQVKNNKMDFDKVNEMYKSNKDIEFINGIDKFHHNKKYKVFSDYVYSSSNIGLIDEILDAESRYIIAIVLKIIPKGYQTFNEVKDSIVSSLKKDKVERDFADLVLRLTTDKIEINEDAIISLKKRYSPNL